MHFHRPIQTLEFGADLAVKFSPSRMFEICNENRWRSRQTVNRKIKHRSRHTKANKRNRLISNTTY